MRVHRALGAGGVRDLENAHGSIVDEDLVVTRGRPSPGPGPRPGAATRPGRARMSASSSWNLLWMFASDRMTVRRVARVSGLVSRDPGPWLTGLITLGWWTHAGRGSGRLCVGLYATTLDLSSARRRKLSGMALEDYKKKRDFSKTPEPPGEARAPGGSSYCIQKHAASRLHYDFRLELDGVLLSWAVPKGPSFDPRDKRLAMHVEDHPVEYGSFEGVIPEGEYGGGTVVLWDRGTWTPLIDPRLGLKKGELKFELHGEKLERQVGARQDQGGRSEGLAPRQGQGRARAAGGRAGHRERAPGERPQRSRPRRGGGGARPSLALEGRRAKGGEVDPGGPAEGDGGARLRLADLAGARRGPLPPSQPLALAMVVEAPPEGDEWLHEIKHDGYRIVARIEEGEVRLVSRNGKDWTKEFPQVARAVGRLPAGTALLDGEVAAVLPSGATSFQALQRRADGAAPARLLRLRPPAPRRLGPAGREARGAQGGAAASARSGAGRHSLQRPRPRPGARVLREGARGRASRAW